MENPWLDMAGLKNAGPWKMIIPSVDGKDPKQPPGM